MNKDYIKRILQHDLGPSKSRMLLASRLLAVDYPEHALTLKDMAEKAEHIARDIAIKERPYEILP